MRRLSAILLLALGVLHAPRGAHAIEPATARFLPAPPAAGSGVPERGILPLTIDSGSLAAMRTSPSLRLSLPLADGRTAEVGLERFDLFTAGSSVHATGVTTSRALDYRPVVFRGAVTGEPGSIVVMVMTDGGVMGHVLVGPARYVLHSVEGTGQYELVDERLHPASSTPFHCSTGPAPAPDGVQAPRGSRTPAGPEAIQSPFPSQVQYLCRLAVDCDYEFGFNTFGGNLTAATNYLTLVYATMAAIYERDLGATFRISYLNFWTTPSDPWTMSDPQAQVAQFAGWWGSNRDTVTRDLAQLVCSHLGGGYAYYSLCSHYNSYAAYGMFGGYTGNPANSVADVFIASHETGHNFGSQHTQDCFWQANGYCPPGALLDSCVAPNTSIGEGDCYSGPTGITPPDLGTIMSYCGAVRLEFHNACKLKMRGILDSGSNCLAPAPVQPPRNLVATLIPGGAAINWTPSPTAGVIRYDVYRSSQTIDINAPLLGSSTTNVLVDPSPGNYLYKVRAVRASDQSAPSREFRTSLCPPGPVSPFTAGNRPVAILSRDLNGDGVLDLAVANRDGATATVLIAQRCGPCTTPFGVPVTLALGTHPSGLAAGDFNADGAMDLAITIADSGTVTIALGQPNNPGTFAVSGRFTAAGSPAGIVAGDFDEDGVLDLAVACGAGQVAVLRGLSTAGVANGSFAAPSLAAVGAGAGAIVSGDFNADGIADLAVTDNSGVRVLLGQGSGGRGDGAFAAAVPYGAGSGASAIATGDFDEDGVTDLAVTATGSNAVAVLHGNGNGTFGAATLAPAGAAPQSLAVGDWNQDGIADLAVTNPGASTISILPGLGSGGVGNGTFASPQPASAGGTPEALAAGEYNDDGRPDLAVAGGGASGQARIVPVNCAGPYTAEIGITAPTGGEFWLAPSEHTLQWTKGPGVIAVNLEVSRDSGATWQAIATQVTGTSLTWTATGPYTTKARIRVSDAVVPSRQATSAGAFTLFPSALLGIGGRPVPALALDRVGPNPSHGSLEVWLTLPSGAPATLELLDVAGRRVRGVDVGRLGPGAHRIELEASRGLRSGVYLVRLTQTGRVATAKAVLVR